EKDSTSPFLLPCLAPALWTTQNDIPEDDIVKCTNVLWPDLASGELRPSYSAAATVGSSSSPHESYPPATRSTAFSIALSASGSASRCSVPTTTKAESGTP